MADMRLIDANALLNKLRHMAKYQPEYKCSTILGVCLTIESEKNIDAVPVVHAKWNTHTFINCVDSYGNPDTCAECSECGFRWNSEREARNCFRYCPDCGAKMDAKEE